MLTNLRCMGLRALAVSLALFAVCHAQELTVTPENGRGVYQPGQTIGWKVRVKDADVSSASFVIKRGGQTEVGSGKLPLAGGEGHIEAKLEEPGWLLAEVNVMLSDQKQLKALGGALMSPEKLRPALPRPDDFDSFWDAKVKELAAVPANPQLVSAESDQPNVAYYKLTLDNIRGSHIRGQLARPKEGGKFPATLIVQWAGVYALQKSWATHRAAEGWLVLNINAHDLPIDEPEQFYKDQSSGPLKDYPSLGNDDRETSYFLRMYLSCFRAAQYLCERSDWDGRTLVVTGGSQGGLQSIVTAALHPKITALLADVPAGCDLSGPIAGRLPGWPMWYWNTKDKNEAKVRNTARYYDVGNFASRVKCPALVGIGLIDTTCPSPGIFAACNQFLAAKELVVLPVAEHGEKNGSHQPYYARFNAWNQALAKGAPVPPGN